MFQAYMIRGDRQVGAYHNPIVLAEDMARYPFDRIEVRFDKKADYISLDRPTALALVLAHVATALQLLACRAGEDWHVTSPLANKLADAIGDDPIVKRAYLAHVQ